MPKPKTGTIVIKQEAGKNFAYVRNQGGQEFLAEGLGGTLQGFDGKECTFNAKSEKIQQISVEGTTYDVKPDRPATPHPKKIISAAEAKQVNQETEPEVPFDSTPEPELKEVDPCQKRKPIAGANLFNGHKDALKVPADSAEQINALFGNNKKNAKLEIENFALVLNKCAHFFAVNEQGKPVYDPKSPKYQAFIFRQTFDDRSGKPKVKRKFEIEFDFPPDLIAYAKRRQQSVIDSWLAAGWEVQSTNFTPDFRLIMGLGTASVFETSLTLHHIYGIPYLPASSIKGVTRSWVIVNYFLPEFLGKDKANEKAEKAAMQDPIFAYLFGSDTSGPDKKAHRGHVMFFDAFPQSPPVIEPDIMNVHYPDWYGKGKAPTDTQSPNPIPFLTMGKCDADQKSLHVRFDLAVRANLTCESILEKTGKGSDWWKKLTQGEKLDSQTTVLSLAHRLLSSALTSHGIGAKTAVGYGFFQQPSE